MTDGSRAPTPVVTAGLDLGDKYSYLYLIDQHSGEVMEEGRLRTTPELFRRHGLKIAGGAAKNARKRAVVAVARKLSVLLDHLWISGEV